MDRQMEQAFAMFANKTQKALPQKQMRALPPSTEQSQWKNYCQQQATSSKEQHAGICAFGSSTVNLNNRLKQECPQLLPEHIEQRRWYSYCFQIGTGQQMPEILRKVYPRNLTAYSKCFIQLAESGYFHATPDKHKQYVEEYRQRLDQPDGAPDELSIKKPRLAEADKTFEEIRMYLRESKALNVTDLIRWASQQKNENIKTRLVTQLFRRTNFPQLVEKALNVNKFEQTGGTWYDKLINWSPKKGGYMSIADSITVLKMFHNHNGIPIQSSVRGKSLTQMFDEILSKRLTKINAIVLHGDSNAGKSIVLNSAFKVYPDWGMMYQGITNNFMFEGLEDMEVCIWEEALFSPNQQETIKLVLEGAETSVAAKYRKNVMIPRVPIGITCNVIPWRAILIQAHQTAFVNRCHILQCNEMPALSDYSGAGKIHPQAWLHLDAPYWSQVNGSIPQKQEEEGWNWSDDEEGEEALSILEDCSHHTDIELASDTGSRYAR
ncbi:hypothetical protein OS493_002031 [Desmophyllum pertusum]|uniref:Parvovirus non-structural protein 1 helicase domain-containing protein n=1 Tax=Desmophyllum pertusum TaxID=174260 RepID=A0A9X0CV10_9CNID|nr:hypothetical protein OS493_002031 [Desmophyllum pertusum]